MKEFEETNSWKKRGKGVMEEKEMKKKMKEKKNGKKNRESAREKEVNLWLIFLTFRPRVAVSLFFLTNIYIIDYIMMYISI